MVLASWLGSTVVHADAAVPWQLGLQDPASPVAEGILRFHHDLMFIRILVVVFVCWIIGRLLWGFHRGVNYRMGPGQRVHGTLLEIVWTVVPALILVVIAVPSFALLYSVDEVVDPALTLKVIGHQWYWSYEYSDVENEDGEAVAFDAYLVPDEDLAVGELRLLNTDNRVVLPAFSHIRLIITAADVLHCWTVPSFGVKLDACPGRLNQAALFVTRPGLFYGQCSEICGVNHGFMPITVEVKSVEGYVAWLAEELGLGDDVEVAEA